MFLTNHDLAYHCCFPSVNFHERILKKILMFEGNILTITDQRCIIKE
ncbi:hypothetical protein D931_00939 [Enterococcus faecium 13.SD.W.09]|nr:hypothetical protein D931_00939 [Enterococcus faecium 13.SD.W.09]